MEKNKSPIESACEVAGSQAELARLIGVTPPSVHQWVNQSRPIPIEKCVDIERVTHGAVMRWDLRPDDWPRIWPELTHHPSAPAHAAGEVA